MKLFARKWLALASLLGVSSLALGSDDCIRLLAKLSDSINRFLMLEPRALQVVLTRPTAGELLALKRNPSKRELFYVVTDDNQLFLSPKAITLQEYGANFAVVPGSEPPKVVPVRESGVVKYLEPKQSRLRRLVSFGKKKEPAGFVFEQTSGFESSVEELAELVERSETLKSLDGEDAFLKADRPGVSATRTIKCSEILDSQTRGKKFLTDNLTNTLSFGVAGILLTSPERFVDPDKQNLVAADLSSSAVNTVLRGYFNYYSISRGDPLIKRYMVRAGTMPPSIFVQSMVYSAFGTENVLGMGGYLMGYSLVMIPKGDLIDRFLIETLPRISYEQCLANSAWRFVFNSRTVRIADQLGSTVLFYLGRDLIQGR